MNIKLGSLVCYAREYNALSVNRANCSLNNWINNMAETREIERERERERERSFDNFHVKPRRMSSRVYNTYTSDETFTDTKSRTKCSFSPLPYSPLIRLLTTKIRRKPIHYIITTYASPSVIMHNVRRVPSPRILPPRGIIILRCIRHAMARITP